MFGHLFSDSTAADTMMVSPSEKLIETADYCVKMSALFHLTSKVDSCREAMRLNVVFCVG